MKFAIYFVVFFTINILIQAQNVKIVDIPCNFINDNIESVELDCSLNSTFYDSPCNKFIRKASNHEKVKVLKTGNCNGNGLYELRSFKNLTELDISYYGIEEFCSDELRFSNLKKLNVSYNKLWTISTSLENLPKLMEIELSYNEIGRSLSTSSFISPDLVKVNVSHNQLSIIHFNRSVRGGKLRVLDLSYNDIRSIDDGGDPENGILVSLEELYLQNNQLQEFNVKLPIPNLKLINLAHNHLHQLFMEVPRTENLKTLILADNQLNNLDMIKPTTFFELKSLSVANNRFNCEYLKVFLLKWPTLNIIDQPGTQITDHIIDCVKKIRNVTDEFKTTTPKIESSVTHYFEHVLSTEGPQNRAEVMIKQNDRFQRFDCEVHIKPNLGNLRRFDISGSELEDTVEIIKLLGKSLESLVLTSNFIGVVDSNTFAGLTNLRNLSLSRTNLSKIETNAFLNQKNLRMLDLSQNNLENVNFLSSMESFNELEILNLDGNSLIEAENVNPMKFPALRLLGISNNRFPCEYLNRFLTMWKDIKLIGNLSNDGMNIRGVNCYF